MNSSEGRKNFGKEMKRNTIILLVLVSLVSIIGFLIYAELRARPRHYVAVVGPMSGESRSAGTDMVNAVSMQLDKLNRSGGIDGRPVELLVFDDANDPDRAAAVAAKIAKDERIVAVLGHYFSSTSLAAGGTYREHRLPAITASATADSVTARNDWYYRIIFSNRYQGAFIAQFVHKVLGYQRSCVIFDEDAYGASLADAFQAEAETVGLDVLGRHAVTGNTSKQDLQALAASVREYGDDIMIFLATHAPEGAQLVTALRSRAGGNRVAIIGADALGTDMFIDTLNTIPQERARPGFFSDGIYVAAPYIPDISARQAQVFRNDFRRRFGTQPSWTAAGYYDAAGIVLDALLAVSGNIGDKDTDAIRDGIRRYLEDTSNPMRAYQGVTCNIHFDQNGDVVRPLRIGRFQNQMLLSAFAHVDIFVNREPDLDTLLQQALANNILVLGDNLMKRIQIINTGLQFNEITGLDINKGTFFADFYLWFRSVDDFDGHDIEFLNAAAPIELGEPVLESNDGAVTKRVYRIRGEFKAHFQLADYPFDAQNLEISFRHRKLTTQDAIFVADIREMDCFNVDTWLQDMQKGGVFSGIRAWNIIDAWIFQNVQNTFSNRDRQSRGKGYTGVGFSQFNTVIRIQRNVVSHAIKNLIPIIAIAIASYCIYFIRMNEASMFSLRFNITLSSLLTLSFFHLKLSNDLPEIDYLVAMEYGFFVLYFLFAFGMLASVLCRHYMNRDRPEIVTRLSAFGTVFYPATIITAIVVMYWKYMR